MSKFLSVLYIFGLNLLLSQFSKFTQGSRYLIQSERVPWLSASEYIDEEDVFNESSLYYDGNYGGASGEPTMPLEYPPCLLSSTLNWHSDNLMYDRKPLTTEDIQSERVQIATLLSTYEYMYDKQSSILEVMSILGGCKMNIAGELLWVMFTASERVLCEHAKNINCTSDFITLDRECRARIYLGNETPAKPFYINCQDPEYFTKPWRRISE